jgi:maltoporin
MKDAAQTSASTTRVPSRTGVRARHSLASSFALAAALAVLPRAASAQNTGPGVQPAVPQGGAPRLPSGEIAGQSAQQTEPPSTAAEAEPAPAEEPKRRDPASPDMGTKPSAEPSTSEVNPAARTPLDASRPLPPPDLGRFEFGSYGRVTIASDGRGRTGRPADVVSFGSRLDEPSYAELELRREDTFHGDVKTRVVTTVALLPPFFHFDGVPEDALAVRQLYAQGTYDNWTLWGGARMYRGDDIYLLNWWPLDNQNTVGGGIGKKLPSDTLIALHAGMQRLDNRFQFQEVPAVAPYGFGAVPVTILDRPRTIETLRVTQFFRNTDTKKYWDDDKRGMKVVLYGEAHQIPSGIQRDTTLNLDKFLPADNGFLVGGQIAYWTGERDTYISLFLRHARGLAAYDPLATPITFANDRSTAGTNDTTVALGGNYERGAFGLAYGAYVRFFRDAGPSPTSLEKFDEGIVIARPQIYIGEHWGIGVEGSYQQRRYAIAEPDGESVLSPSLWRGAILPYFSPSGRGTFKRPQISLVWASTLRNTDTRRLYPAEDIFAQRRVEHFIGLTTEWWFNSSSYP